MATLIGPHRRQSISPAAMQRRRIKRGCLAVDSRQRCHRTHTCRLRVASCLARRSVTVLRATDGSLIAAERAAISHRGRIAADALVPRLEAPASSTGAASRVTTSVMAACAREDRAVDA
jgi:hypothetical protein